MREQPVQPFAHQRGGWFRVALRRFAGAGAGTHGIGHGVFVRPVAAQVQAAAGQHQRLACVGAARPGQHLRASLQECMPGRQSLRQLAGFLAQALPVILAPAQHG